MCGLWLLHALGSAAGADCKGQNLKGVTVVPASVVRPQGSRPHYGRWCGSRNGEVSMRSLGETSLEHADERDLIETFVGRSRWHCRAARETFRSDEFRPVTTELASTT